MKKTNRARLGRTGKAIEVPASEVKNAWHEFVDRVSQAREEIVVTRYGKPVMKLSPIDEPEDRPGIFGCLAGTVTVHGDLVAPTEEVWEADA
jgi:prevent-host-death family protein